MTACAQTSRRRGRPSRLSELSDDDKARLLDLLRRGAPKTWACRAIGVCGETLENYRRRAKKGEEPFRSFVRDVDQAQAVFVNRLLRVLDADAVGAPLTEDRERGNSASIKWLLERLFPKDFGRLRRVESTGREGGPLRCRVEVIQRQATEQE